MISDLIIVYLDETRAGAVCIALGLEFCAMRVLVLSVECASVKFNCGEMAVIHVFSMLKLK